MLDKMARPDTGTRSCSTCGRLRPGVFSADREAPVCRQPDGSECKAAAAERQERLTRSASRLKSSYW
jgi:hypothetical protein